VVLVVAEFDFASIYQNNFAAPARDRLNRLGVDAYLCDNLRDRRYQRSHIDATARAMHSKFPHTAGILRVILCIFLGVKSPYSSSRRQNDDSRSVSHYSDLFTRHLVGYLYAKLVHSKVMTCGFDLSVDDNNSQSY
jgi:hypothetical protein